MLVTPLAVTDATVLVGLQGDTDTQPVIVALDAGTGEDGGGTSPRRDRPWSPPCRQGYCVRHLRGPVRDVGRGLGPRRRRRTLEPPRELHVRRDRPGRPAESVFVTDLIGHTRAFDATSGEQRWDFAQNAPAFRSVPVLVGAHLLVPTLEGELGAIDAETGELVWRLPADGAPLRSLASAGEVLVATRGGFDRASTPSSTIPTPCSSERRRPRRWRWVAWSARSRSRRSCCSSSCSCWDGCSPPAWAWPSRDAAPGAEDEPVVPLETDAEDPTP